MLLIGVTHSDKSLWKGEIALESHFKVSYEILFEHYMFTPTFIY